MRGLSSLQVLRDGYGPPHLISIVQESHAVAIFEELLCQVEPDEGMAATCDNVRCNSSQMLGRVAMVGRVLKISQASSTLPWLAHLSC
jgi:hypothetical protein